VVEKSGDGVLPQQEAESPRSPVSNPLEVSDLPEPAHALAQATAPARDTWAKYSTEAGRSPLFMESADSDYMEYLVPGPGDRQLVMRLPKKVRMRYGQPSEDLFYPEREPLIRHAHTISEACKLS